MTFLCGRTARDKNPFEKWMSTTRGLEAFNSPTPETPLGKWVQGKERFAVKPKCKTLCTKAYIYLYVRIAE